MRVARPGPRRPVEIIRGPIIDIGFTASDDEASPGLVMTAAVLGTERAGNRPPVKYRLEFTDADIDALVEARKVRDRMTADPRPLPVDATLDVDSVVLPHEVVPGSVLGQVGTWGYVMSLPGGRTRLRRLA